MLLAAGGCCGYGGPGCAEPFLVGICAAQVPLGESGAVVSYGDDTGAHPSDYGWVSAAPEDRLVARAGSGPGEVILEGRGAGPAQLSIGAAEGWDDGAVFRYTVEVVAQVSAPCEEGQDVLLADPAPAGDGAPDPAGD